MTMIMTPEKDDILQYLKELLEPHEILPPPATASQLRVFAQNAAMHGVPQSVIDQLKSLYAVCDRFTEDVCLSFHESNDITLFEWWNRDGDLWLGQRHFYTTRWCSSLACFCLGDASNVSFGREYEHATLAGYLEWVVRYIRGEMSGDP